ncbi:MAG: FKBP-type peptidyl-prolyl cis-trans isomerase [Bacteroidales bacterium]|nr:FKBP-type peptidyl-prolyl cis-trans isomerase [Bacteroidales bacterium]
MNSISVLLLSAVLISCTHVTEKNSASTRPGSNDMADLNRYLVQKDRERIQNYIERKNLRMTETRTGLWYQILKEGEGETFGEKDLVIIDYECSLLDGTRCYSSRDTGPRELILGRSEMEAGLNEGLRLLKPGSEAIFIIPPFLAYGLVGDRRLIPPRAVLFYSVTAKKK